MNSIYTSIQDFDKEDIIDQKDTQKQTEINYEDLSRRDVRSLIFHFLYAAEAFEYLESLQSIIENFNNGFNLNVPLNGEIFTITNSIINNRNELEKTYEPFLANWRSERISTCTKLILLFSVWEFKNTKIDARIIINEAIELAKCFAEEDAYRFINGVLDPISKEFCKEASIEN